MNKIKLVTHSGRFHADDVFATAVLMMLLEKQGKEFELIRSRKSEDIESGDIVYDNGREYDEERKKFDHHQEGGAGERENGVPYAAFGLIWKHYGKVLIEEFLKEKFAVESIEKENNQNACPNSSEDINKIFQLIDESLVQPIDASDTGYEDFKSSKKNLRTYVMDSAVKSFNPTDEEGYEKAQKLFLEFVEIAKKILARELISTEHKIKGFKMVESAYENAEDKRIIILNEGGSWREILVSHTEPLYVIFPTVDSDGFMIQAVNKEISGYEVRKSFPKNWRGKGMENNELEKETGIAGTKFCHLKGFLCVTKTKEQAIAIAEKAICG